MKRNYIAILSLAFLLLFMATSCSQQMTVREREMKKFEKINPDLVIGMPQLVQDTVEAYNSGDYQKAATGFYAIMNNKDWDRLHDTARYYYAESLFRVGLYQASEYQLAEILFEGPQGHYFVSALLKLLAVTYKTHDERVLIAVLSNVDYNALPKKFANELTYYLGKINFYNGQDDAAIKMFSKVKSYSSFYPASIYFLGVIYVRQQMYAEAMKKFMEIKKMSDNAYIGADMKKMKGMAELALGELYYAAAWKSKNKLAMFNVSLDYFNKVNRDNEQWFEALFARTWASLMIGRFDSTLGTVVTLRSPFFTDIYFPEVNIVEAVTYYNLCRYDLVNDVVDNFFKIYPAYRQNMENFIEGVSIKTGVDIYQDILVMYKDAVEGKQTDLPEPVLKAILTDKQFLKKYYHIKEVERELTFLEKTAKPYFKNSPVVKDLEKKMLYQLITLRNEAGKWIVTYLQSKKQDLVQLLADMKAIRFEMTDKMKSTYEKEELFGKKVQKKTKKSKKKAEFNPSVPDGSSYWPFDGEYWQDELGYYFYNIESKCKE